MILVDSSVWIDYFMGKITAQTERLDRLLGHEPLAIGDLILTEVQRFHNERDFNDDRRRLTALTVVELGGQAIAIQSGEAEGVSDFGRTPDARPCAHVYCDSTQAPGRLGDRIPEREERHCHGPAGREGDKLLEGTFLGLAATRCPQSVLNWNRCVSTSANRKPRMAITKASEAEK